MALDFNNREESHMKTFENATPAVQLAYQVACNNMLAEGTTAADMAEAWALIAQEDAQAQATVVAAILADPAVLGAARVVAEAVVARRSGLIVAHISDTEINDINTALASMGFSI